jgi:ribose transport system permease protein
MSTERSAIWVVLLALLGVAALFSDAFLQPAYLLNMVRQAAPVGLAAIGVTLVMVMGGVDLSVGAVISLAAVVAAVLMDGQAGNIGYALAATLTIGAAIGFANGVLIAGNRVSPFILTLGTAVAVYGLTQIYSGGTARGIVAPGFRDFFNQRIGGLVPVLALLFLAAAGIAVLAQRTTRFGRSLYLVGSNPRAARLAGLSAARLTVAAYTLSGLLAALGGIALLARSGVSSTFAGRGFEFDALAAVVLGGTTFEGGRGGVGGTVAGLLVLFVAFNLVNILGLNYNVQRVVAGVIIIVASAAYTYLTSRRVTESRRRPSHHTPEGIP